MRHLLVAGVFVLALTAPAAAREEKKEDWSRSTEQGVAAAELPEETTVEFEVGDYVAPPRTITDVAALLAQHGQTNAAEVARNRKVASAEPPADASDGTLAEFYRKRGVAAGALGRVKDQIDDLDRALEFAERGGTNTDDILFNLGHAHWAAGNFRQAIEYRKLSIVKTPRKRIASLLIRHGSIAIFEARSGNFEAAQESLDRAENQYRSFRKLGVWAAILRAHISWVKGELYQRQGRYAEAETHFRRGLAMIEADIERGTEAAAYRLYSLSDTRALYKAEFHGLLASSLMRQDRLTEAEIEARNALRTYLRLFGRDSPYTAGQLTGVLVVPDLERPDVDRPSRHRAIQYESEWFDPADLCHMENRSTVHIEQ